VVRKERTHFEEGDGYVPEGARISTRAVLQEPQGEKAVSRFAPFRHGMFLKGDLQPPRFAILFFCCSSFVCLMKCFFESCCELVAPL
jgi:hypothetical protein